MSLLDLAALAAAIFVAPHLKSSSAWAAAGIVFGLGILGTVLVALLSIGVGGHP